MRSNSLRFQAIFFSQREGASDIPNHLPTTDILNFQLTKHNSRRKQQFTWCLKLRTALRIRTHHKNLSSWKLCGSTQTTQHSYWTKLELNLKVGEKQEKARQKRSAKKVNRLRTDSVVRSFGELPVRDQISAPIRPAIWRRLVLRKREKWKAYIERATCFENFVNAIFRTFLQRCLDNDLIPNFLRFRVPKTIFIFLASEG